MIRVLNILGSYNMNIVSSNEEGVSLKNLIKITSPKITVYYNLHQQKIVTMQPYS